ncbi:MAG: DUF47 domain-containing protein [Desulfurococcales archaeon]|nr:DUF47 domain-containing protein [Desulfurococcales archaeon]
MSTWIWLSSRKEKSVLLMSLKHLDLVYDVVVHLAKLFNALSKMNREEALENYSKVDKLEEKADDVKRDIIEELNRGFIHPFDKENLLRLVLSSDDIASYAKASARRLKIMLELNYSIPDELLTLLASMTENIIKAVDFLRESVKALNKDPRIALNFSHMIEELEERVDDIRLDALKYLYRICGRNFSVECMLYKEVIDNVEMTSDKCEDTGDIIRSIAISIGST